MSRSSSSASFALVAALSALSALSTLPALSACGHAPPPAAPVPLPPAAPAANVPAVDGARLDAQLTPYIQSFGAKLGVRRQLSGFVLVTQHDRPVYARAFGYADREHQVPADADTSFRVGSVTKQFTAAAILVLAQDGKLSVDDPIGKYLPDYPAVGKDLTLHQLLTHTSGLPDYTQDSALMADRGKPHSVADLLHAFWDKPLDFAPGSKFTYSNSNYIVLGAIVERVGGMPYADFVAKRLFAPAGMTRTVVGDADGVANRALGYEPGDDDLVPSTPIDMSVPFAAGAVRSTANDLVKWDRALQGDAILNAASKARLYKPEKDDYAYGWLVKDKDGHRIIGHDGGIDGFETMYLRVPDQDLVVVVWSNNTGVHPQPIAEAALEVALGGTVEPIVEPTVVPLDDAAAARFVGHYKLTDDARVAAAKAGVPAEVLTSVDTIDVSRDGARLKMKPVGQDTFTLDATAPDKYLQLDLGVAIEVALPADGAAATGFTLTQGSLSLAYARDQVARPPAPTPAAPTPPHKDKPRAKAKPGAKP